ncbi:MAG TPA: enoyl-CoA hydratase/isomerase family protein, partial [Polyangia bacterium]
MADVELSRDGHVAHVRLNRPKSLNAITHEMDQVLFDAWRDIDADPDVWVAVLSAEGERAFCVGADVSGGAERKRRMALGGGITGIGGPLVTLRKPLVAAVHGYVLGGGFELAMCADIIVTADTAQFGLPETKVGIIGECGV